MIWERVLFDSRWCGAHGIGRFASEVLAGLPTMRQLSSPLSPSSPIDPLLMSLRIAAAPKHGIVFSPGYNVPLAGFARYVFTVHDLNHLDMPSSSAKRLYYRWLMRKACRNAAAVLTVSDFSRRRILEWSGARPESVFNVGNGVSGIFRVDGERLALGSPYFLCVGNRKPHKNEVRLVRAFASADIPKEYLLAFTGQSDPLLEAAATACGVHGRIRFLGVLNDDVLAKVYRGAVALLFPSLYEGFGLPVLESMASGTPVMTSKAASLPEVCGGAALLVDPLSEGEIAFSIHRLASEGPLRSMLRADGLRRAAEFRWSDVVARVRVVLGAVLANG